MSRFVDLLCHVVLSRSYIPGFATNEIRVRSSSNHDRPKFRVLCKSVMYRSLRTHEYDDIGGLLTAQVHFPQNILFCIIF